VTKRTYKKSVDGRDVCIYLSDLDITKAAMIGGGKNISKGVRLALNAYYATLYPDNVDDTDLGADPVPNPDPKPKAHTPAQVADVVGAAPTPKPAATRNFDRVVTEIQPIEDDDDGVISEAEWAEFQAEQARSIAKASQLDAVRASAVQSSS
jgi:hypothetical protein